MQRLLLLFVTIFLFTAIHADAQRQSAYQDLLRQVDRPASYIDHIALPADDSSVMVSAFFRIEYDFLPFMRKRPNMSPPSDAHEYFSPVRLGWEIYSGEHRPSRRDRAQPSGTSVFRDSFSDTVWVETFEDTRSRFDHLQGVLSTSLEPGTYHYLLQLSRGGSERELPSQFRNLNIRAETLSAEPSFILAERVERSDNRLNAHILNYRNNVLYGQDFDLLIRLPQGDESAEAGYTVEIYRVTSGGQTLDTPHFSSELSPDLYFTSSSPSVRKSEGSVALTLEGTEKGASYAFLSIPNSEYENSQFKIVLKTSETGRTVGERTIQSRWIDMPVSLYNLDVAINMLRFIVSDRELRRLNSGSDSERERKFREFWAERDPTPDTEFNELMAEYYSRIDYAYQNFSSLQVPGYDSDRGRAYILYGPPSNIDRRLLPNQPTREIWVYPNRELVFEAVSGLGDFRLVSESNR